MTFCYEIAGVRFAVQHPRSLELAVSNDIRRFAAEYGPDVDVHVAVRMAERLERASLSVAFDSGVIWQLKETAAGSYLIEFQTDFLGAAPYKTMEVDRAITRADIQLNAAYFDGTRVGNALEYPLDELLMILKLGTGLGIEVHGCGVEDRDGRGILFIGHSGAGKSTTSRLWMQEPGVRVLSDDRIILRRAGDDLIMHGTPWHGDAGVAENHSVPVSAIFVLEHGERNETIPLAHARAAAEITSRCFMPFHSHDAVDFTLQFAGQVALQVPVQSFRFRPDRRAVDFVRKGIFV